MIKKPVVLVGLMGSGKTTIGVVLARRLSVPFFDSDQMIEEQAGATVPEIFERDGEEFFRKVEAKTIKKTLEDAKNPLVLATGGGAFMNKDTRQVIKKNAISIWLNADLEILVDRVEHKHNRPLLKGVDVSEKMQTLIDERYPIYKEADIMVDTNSNSRTIIMTSIMDGLKNFSQL